MLKTAKFFLCAAGSLMLGFCLYFCGGVLLAFCSLALSGGGDFLPSAEISAKLENFLADPAQKSEKLTFDQLNAGVFGIISAAAREASPKGAVCSMPAAPVFSALDGKLALSLPVSLDLIFRRAEMNAVFAFDFDGAPKLACARLGAARLPRFFALPLAEILYKPYANLAGVVRNVERAEKLRSVSIAADGVVFEK